MIEIDYLQIAQDLRKNGMRNGIRNAILKAAKATAAGNPYRLINKPGDVLELEDPEDKTKTVKYLISSKGRISKIS